ncbi:hypothetical protein [Pseudohoeflea coraliihabitans]|uniref:Transposase n=1 Tax=Pseudohoeflea coraliihabitans TaxID=2860393 RepID=A0ABS6WP52_9HYPH|nr:hypothetical protein [Pseudohoeflea sp. DP4N28-3]MBW3096854.1 hypothetical protein [Pseudohoeflea sp. DP4N28-3]
MRMCPEIGAGLEKHGRARKGHRPVRPIEKRQQAAMNALLQAENRVV